MNCPARHSIVFFAGLPLSQNYDSLQALFKQSPVLDRLRGGIDRGLSSNEYLKELSNLKVGTDISTTFGASQLDMWKRCDI
jgi:hypothetical protein